MRFLHLSDLHIGKRVNEFSMLEDQRYILEQILSLIEEHHPQAVIIAGDIYDKGIPTVEAVTLFDWFLTELHERDLSIFIVSGNHDSSERLDFGGKIFKKKEIYIGSSYQGELQKITLEDEYGMIDVRLMPFLKPVMVRKYFEGVESYQDAIRSVLEKEQADVSRRNLLVAHQFITSGGDSPVRCDSEVISVGGLDNIDASVFDDYDYVALGHLHGAQRIGRDTVRYAGSPLKYSFSEARQVKSVTLVDMKEKGTVEYEKLLLTPLRDMREIKGPIEKLIEEKIYAQGNTQDYIHAILTDEEEIYDAIGRLRSVYPNIMKLDFENKKTMWISDMDTEVREIDKKTTLELFSEFFMMQNHIEMSGEQEQIVQEIFEEIGGEVL